MSLLRLPGLLIPILLCAAPGGFPASVSAQSPPRVRVGVGLGPELLAGDASDFLDGGVVRFLTTAVRVDHRDALRLRVDLTSTPLDDDEDALRGTRARNHLVTLTAGPQVVAHLGRLHPHAAVMAGLAGVRWTMEGPGRPADPDGFSSALGWGGHAGLGFEVTRGRHPLLVFLEARVFDIGTQDYARTPNPRNTEEVFGLLEASAVALSLRVGMTLGL